MYLVEFAVDRRLVLQVLAMQPLDQLMSWLSALIVGMMAVAEQELATRRGCCPTRQQPGSWQLYFLTNW